MIQSDYGTNIRNNRTRLLFLRNENRGARSRADHPSSNVHAETRGSDQKPYPAKGLMMNRRRLSDEDTLHCIQRFLIQKNYELDCSISEESLDKNTVSRVNGDLKRINPVYSGTEEDLKEAVIWFAKRGIHCKYMNLKNTITRILYCYILPAIIVFRTYPSSPVALHVIIPKAKCSMAM